MDGRKTYSPPQLFRVELSQNQAILSACSLLTNTASQGGNGGCRPASAGGCKRRNGAGGRDSGARPS
jgi:hypothetical protein